MRKSHLAALVLASACSNASSGQQPDAPSQAIDAAADATPDAPAHTAALSYTGGTYVNHFDGLPSTTSSASGLSQTVTGQGPFPFTVLSGEVAASGMDGWQFANPMGSGMDTEFRVQDGSISGSMGRGVVSYGVDGSTERALGTLTTSNQVDRFGLIMRNDTGGTLTQITVSYVGEQWRRGTVTMPDSLAFDYGVGMSIDDTTLTTDADLAFVAPNTQTSPTDVAVDGTMAANRHALSKNLSGLPWDPGTLLILRWTSSQQSGHDDGLSVDDFSFAAAP